MVDFSIESNIIEFQKLVGRHKKQIPFATKKALNETTADARKFVISRIRRRQKSRKQWFNSSKYGIRRTFAKKKSLIASLFTLIHWADLQEKGGTKQPHKGKFIAIPTNNVPQSYRKSGGAGRMLELKKTFVPEKFPAPGILRRKTKKRLPIERLFSFKARARIDDPILHFKKDIEIRVKRKFPRFHRAAMIHAIKTARR